MHILEHMLTWHMRYNSVSTLNTNVKKEANELSYIQC
jgi:hypothetical protein